MNINDLDSIECLKCGCSVFYTKELVETTLQVVGWDEENGIPEVETYYNNTLDTEGVYCSECKTLLYITEKDKDKYLKKFIKQWEKNKQTKEDLETFIDINQ